MCPIEDKSLPIAIYEIAKVAYESQFEESFDDLSNKSIEFAIWIKTAENMMKFNDCRVVAFDDF